MSLSDLTNARPILKRVLEQNDLAGLSADERQTLERLAGVGVSSVDDGERPLWYWIRDGAWGAPKFARDAFFGCIDSELDILMTECGVLASPSATVVGRLLVPITSDALRRGVTTVLREEREVAACGVSALIAAFAGFREAIPYIERLLPEGGEGSLRFVVRDDLRIALAVLDVENLLELLEQDGQGGSTTAIRLSFLGRRGDAVPVEAVRAALGQAGWNLAWIRRFPTLLHHFARSGGDISAAVRDMARNGVFAWWGHEDPYVAMSLARALMSAGDRAVVEALQVLHALESPPRELLKYLYVELAHARCTAALGAMKARLAALELGPEGNIRSADAESLLWPIAALDPAGPTWLQDRIRSNPDDRALVATGALLAATRHDARHLLPPAIAEGLSDALSMVVFTVHKVIAGEPDASLRVIARTGMKELVELTHQLHRVADLGGHPTALLNDLLQLLNDPDESDETQGVFGIDHYALLRLMDMLPSDDGIVRAILSRIRHVPAEFAAGILEGVIARLRSSSSGGPLPSMAHLALVELGCVQDFEHRVSAETLAIVRLHSMHFPRGNQLPEPERSVALSMIGREEGPLQARLASLLQGDACFDVVASSLLYRGAVCDSRPIVGEDVFDRFLRAIGPSERLAAILRNGGSHGDVERTADATTLMASPCARIRTLVLPLLFTHDAPAADLIPLRNVYIRDTALDVQELLLDEIGEMYFTPPEIRFVLSSAPSPFADPGDTWSTFRQTRARASAARAIARLRTPEYLDLLFPLLTDAESSVVAAAQEALRVVVSEGVRDVVLLSISDTSGISIRYGLPLSGMRAAPADQRAVGMGLLLQGIELRADAADVERHAGRRLLMTPVRSWPPPTPSGASLTQTEFERLALHLHVILVDAESGSIVAEVGREPTGEILNAIFETGDTALMQVVWG